MKILNLYAGIGGNRKLWGNEHQVTAVEIDPNIAKIYKDFFPNDKVIVADAHQYLLDHYKEFDFIWSSPPCPSHSRIRNEAGVGTGQSQAIYPEMSLYQEIIFLKHFFNGKWLDEILNEQRSVEGRNLFVLDLSNLIMRNPFFWNKVVEQLQSEAVDKFEKWTETTPNIAEHKKYIIKIGKFSGCYIHIPVSLLPQLTEEARTQYEKEMLEFVESHKSSNIYFTEGNQRRIAYFIESRIQKARADERKKIALEHSLKYGKGRCEREGHEMSLITSTHHVCNFCGHKEKIKGNLCELEQPVSANKNNTGIFFSSPVEERK